jgi:hypothetical protein
VFGNPASFVFLGAFSQAPRPRFMQGYRFSCGRPEMTPTITGPWSSLNSNGSKAFIISYNDRHFVATNFTFMELGMKGIAGYEYDTSGSLM